MDMVEKIRKEMEEQGIKQKDFVEYLGATQSNVSKWLSLNEKIRLDIPNTILAKIAHYINVDIEYLLGLQEEKRKNKTEIVEVEKDIQLDEENYITLPTIHAGAGAEAFAVERAEKRAFPRDLIPAQIALDENVLVMVVVGNSMEPLYYENDIVFIDMVNGREFMPVNGTYLVRYGNTVQIKDVEFIGNGEIMLFSRNSPAIINPTKEGLEWEIVGKPYANLHPNVGSKLVV